MRTIFHQAFRFAIALFALATAGAAHAQCALPYTLTNGSHPDATQVMANFNAILACISPGGSANSVQYNSGTGLAGVGPLTNGQTLIGSSGNPAQAQTLTAGSGITITNSAGNINVAATPGMASTGLYRQVTSALPTAASTGLTIWINQSGATYSEGPWGMTISTTSTTADSLQLRYAPAPAPPYTLTALFATTRNSSGNSESGIGWYDGTAKLHILSFAIPNFTGAQAFIDVAKWSAYNFRVGNDVISATSYYPQPIWLQLKDDGTNVTFAFSYDGANFLSLYTAAKSAAYLGVNGYNNFIFFANPRGAQTTATLMSWAIN